MAEVRVADDPMELLGSLCLPGMSRNILLRVLPNSGGEFRRSVCRLSMIAKTADGFMDLYDKL